MARRSVQRGKIGQKKFHLSSYDKEVVSFCNLVQGVEDKILMGTLSKQDPQVQYELLEMYKDALVLYRNLKTDNPAVNKKARKAVNKLARLTDGFSSTQDQSEGVHGRGSSGQGSVHGEEHPDTPDSEG